MLTELKEYAEDHGLVARVGFKTKAVKGYIVLSAAGDFIDVDPCPKGFMTYAPDIGSAANGTKFCNILIEKAKIPLCIIEDEKKDKNIPTKYDYYVSTLDKGSKAEPQFQAIVTALRSEKTRKQIRQALSEKKLKSGDAVGFKVDGMPVEKSTAYHGWWAQFRQQFAPQDTGELSRCLISGELTIPVATAPKVSGLLAVGGHTSGDAFLCFDKDAFQSYGLKKSANAPVSEEAITAVNAALAQLIQRAQVFGGAKLVHWYLGAVPEEKDPLDDLLNGCWEGEPPEPEAEDREELERKALQASETLLGSPWTGTRPEATSARYYIMPLSGAGGRMMVRGWYQGSFENLHGNIDQWFQDLRLVRPGGGTTPPPKLKALCVRLLKPGGDPAKVYDRMDSELANLSGRLLGAIIHNAPLPDEVASRTLRYIRSKMLEQPAEGQRESPMAQEAMAFQLLKAWLVRHQRQRGDKIMIGESESTSPKTPAFCCGQLMAVYSAIQEKAMPEVNVSVAQRYYAAASTTPAFVIGKLAQLSQHHLAKLEPGLSAHYQRMLGEIYAAIGIQKIPTSLNMEQQTEFALGYYQQRVTIFSKRKEGEQ